MTTSRYRIRVIAELQPDHPAAARYGYRALTLGDYISEIGGLEGTLIDNYDLPREISLAAFAGADPAIPLDLMFVEVAPGREFDPPGAGQVVLAEYDAPIERPAYMPPRTD
ncbi:hypothetical protein [Tsukamurella soli]|uniref:Uncharacterized protein n=1 Tax=Tsukamurella soli TaxID=644556 RepID=A0ABP8JM97_9ACTN